MHCSGVGAHRVVNMKRRKSENDSCQKSGRFTCPAPKINFTGIVMRRIFFWCGVNEIKSQQICAKPGQYERNKEKQIISGDSAENQLKIGINRRDVEFRSFNKLECPLEKSWSAIRFALSPATPITCIVSEPELGTDEKKCQAVGQVRITVSAVKNKITYNFSFLEFNIFLNNRPVA